MAWFDFVISFVSWRVGRTKPDRANCQRNKAASNAGRASLLKRKCRIGLLGTMLTASVVQSAGCSKLPSECSLMLEKFEEIRVILGQPKGTSEIMREQVELLVKLDPDKARIRCGDTLKNLRAGLAAAAPTSDDRVPYHQYVRTVAVNTADLPSACRRYVETTMDCLRYIDNPDERSENEDIVDTYAREIARTALHANPEELQALQNGCESARAAAKKELKGRCPDVRWD